MPIKLLQSRPSVAGHLKIGYAPVRKTSAGDRGVPQKLDHFELTGTERDRDGILLPDIDLMRQLIERGGDRIPTCGGCDRAKALGFPAGLPRRVPVYLPSSDLERVFPHRLAVYAGRTAYCVGDGETAMRLSTKGTREVNGSKVPVYGPAEPYGPCGEACPDFQSGRCKPHGVLRFCVDGAPRVGAVYEFRTTSWNSITNVKESLETILDVAGTVEFIPIFLDLVQKTVQPTRGQGGPATKAWVIVPYFPGTVQELVGIAKTAIEAYAPSRARLAQLVEHLDARTFKEDEDEADEIEREFHGGGSVVVARSRDGGSGETAPQRAAHPRPAAGPDAPMDEPEPPEAPEGFVHAGQAAMALVQTVAVQPGVEHPFDDGPISDEEASGAAPAAAPEANAAPPGDPADAERVGKVERQALVTLLKARGKTTPAECLAFISKLLGRSIARTDELTLGEFKELMRSLGEAV